MLLEKLAITVIAILIIASSYLTFERNIVWNNEISLWQDTIRKSPHKSRPYNSLGATLANEKQYDKAIKNFKIAIKNASGPQEIHHYNLALAYIDKGSSLEAIRELRRAIKIKPDYLNAHYRLGHTYKDLDMLMEAENEFKKTIEQNPKLDYIHNDLGNIYLLQKRYLQAMDEYKRALQLNPKNIEAIYNLAISYDKTGRRYEALEYYLDFIRSAPADYQMTIEYARHRVEELKRR